VCVAEEGGTADAITVPPRAQLLTHATDITDDTLEPMFTDRAMSLTTIEIVPTTTTEMSTTTSTTTTQATTATTDVTTTTVPLTTTELANSPETSDSTMSLSEFIEFDAPRAFATGRNVNLQVLSIDCQRIY
jgi:hypothetical protein